MTISVALACYNGSKFIKQQLESLKNQSLAPDEVVICDDASTDDTADIVQEFIESNGLDSWRFYENDINLGFVKNFRKAASLCGGDIVFLCDQDDVWNEKKIQIMSGIMEKQSNVLSLACGYDIINRFGENAVEAYKPAYGASAHMKTGALRRVPGRVLIGNIAQGCTCAYRSEIISDWLNTGIECRLPHDWLLNLLASEKRGLYYLNLPLVSYRLHENNTTGAISVNESANDRAEILLKLAESTDLASNIVGNSARYRKLASFIRHRARVAEFGGFRSFVRGFAMFPEFAFGRSFLQYCKDYYVSIERRK